MGNQSNSSVSTAAWNVAKLFAVHRRCRDRPHSSVLQIRLVTYHKLFRSMYYSSPQQPRFHDSASRIFYFRSRADLSPPRSNRPSWRRWGISLSNPTECRSPCSIPQATFYPAPPASRNELDTRHWFRNKIESLPALFRWAPFVQPLLSDKGMIFLRGIGFHVTMAGTCAWRDASDPNSLKN